MSLRDSWGTVVRRWYLVLPAALIAAILAVGAYAVAPKKYESQAKLLLLPPVAQAGVDGPGNPYLNLTQGLGMTADVIAVGVTNDLTAARLAQVGGVGTYKVASDLDINAPVLLITVDDRSSAAVTRTLQLVEREVRGQLNAAQKSAGAPTDTWISVSTLSQTPAPLPVRKTPIQLGLIAGTGSMVLFLALVFLIDRRVRRNRTVSTLQPLAMDVSDLDGGPAESYPDHRSSDSEEPADEKSVAQIRS